MAVGSGAVTIVDIARASGVSKSTVSLVLRGSSLVRPKTREKVQGAIEELGYVYNRGAANLRRAHSNIVGMVINDLTNPFFAELAVGIERIFQAAGYLPLIANTAENPLRQSEVLKSMREQGVAGLIICPARGTSPDSLCAFARHGIPVVLAMRRLAGGGLASVAPDSRLGAREASAHLVALGHRRIAFFGGYADMVVHGERCGGYLDALAAAGLARDDALIIEGPPDRDGGLAALDRCLGLPDPPTAALCFNDVVAFGVLLGLKKRGLEPGRDFAVIGFDDLAEAKHTVPALTTVAVDSFGLGERAAQSALKMIQSQKPHAEHYAGTVQLVVRESCGSPPRQHEGGAS